LRYFLELAYNGKNYFGWQKQPKQISVQEVLENSLSTILRSKIEITGAGRTDTGVHAKKMYAHFEYDDKIKPDFVHRMNAFLPKDIVIYKVFPVHPEAHARFDATDRTYHYFVQIGKDPFNFDAAWQIRFELDIDRMNEAAQKLLGTQDFSSFAKLHTDVKTHICTVKFAEWVRCGNELKFTITADRFLRNMVRAIVGTLVDVGKGKISLEDFNNIIEQKDRSFASGSAPAQGLYLVDVVYPETIYPHE
jgi:tRNA pseudouridine38-40 synthase